jgi:hypothetical protein
MTADSHVHQSEKEALDALRCVVATQDSNLMEEDHDLDDLFERGLIATVRDYADEYHAVLTPNGRAFVREVVARGPHT